MSSPFQPIPMGSFVKSISISRSNVAKGTKGRAVLIDPNPRAIYLAYDNAHKCAVLADQETVIKYKLSPRTYYLFLLARLNTDMTGKQVNDEFIVEYLRLSENVYNDFIDGYNEMDSVNSLVLKPVTKQGQNGQDFSYVAPVASKELATDEVYAKIEQLDVEALWNLVQVDLGKTVEEYEAILAADPVSENEARRIESQSSGNAPIRGQIPAQRAARPQQPKVLTPSSQQRAARPQQPSQQKPPQDNDFQFEDRDDFAEFSSSEMME